MGSCCQRLRWIGGEKSRTRIFPLPSETLPECRKAAPEVSPERLFEAEFLDLVARVPEDHVAAFLAFDRREVREDFAGSDLRICERD